MTTIAADYSLAAAAVAKGADLLDTYEPGWSEAIDFDLLDLSDPDACVIGQVYHGRSFSGADYVYGLDLLSEAEGVSRDDNAQFATDHGFDHWPMAALQQAWQDEILSRRH